MIHGVAARRLPAVLGGVVALTIGVSGCSTVIEGSAHKDPSVSAESVNTALLQPGNYPTTKQAPPEPSARAGAITDVHQLADHVIGPWQVDPALTQPIVTTIGPAIASPALNLVLRAPGADIANSHGFVNGFASGRAEPDQEVARRAELINVVMRFPNDQDAVAVATDTHQQMEPPLDAASSDPVPVSGHPEALAKKALAKDGRTVVSSFTARGPFVLFQEAVAVDGARAEALVSKTLDLQLPAIDSFQPADPAQFATMDTDPTHLWSRTLPTGNKIIPAMGVYGASGALHFLQPGAQQWFETAGVDAVSFGQGGNRVYQARDAAAAATLADQVGKDYSDEAKPAGSVPGMPSARCFFADKSALKYICTASADRWVMITASQQEKDAAQQLAAQYLILVGK